MKSTLTVRSVALWFLVVLALYLVCFYGCEAVRHQKGAWEVNFSTDAAGNPAIVAYQPQLNISSVEIIFVGGKIAVTNLSERVVFDRPKQRVPFGEVIFEDLTFLPGVVTFDFFGHEVELLPRALVINKKEVPWKSDSTIELSATNKLTQAPKPPQPR